MLPIELIEGHLPPARHLKRGRSRRHLLMNVDSYDRNLVLRIQSGDRGVAIMKLIISAFVIGWLLSACASTIPNDDSPGAENWDARTGLCNDATPPPCNSPPD